MDRDLHLLMLMQRQLEEARRSGVEGPNLEYREEPWRLKVWVVGGGDGQEIIDTGVGEESRRTMEPPAEVLRNLAAQGYIKLNVGDEESGGLISITGEGFEKIRQRKSFEANLPRRLTMPEVSLRGGPKVGVMNLWRADWEGHAIRVRNRLYLSIGGHAPDATEYLEIDGRLAHLGIQAPPGIDRPLPYHLDSPQPWWSKDLYGELRTSDGVHEVHAHVGLTAPFRTPGCLISVDGTVVGGDVGKRFVT